MKTTAPGFQQVFFSSDGAEESSSNNTLFDEVALARKNKSRRRFGLKPITPEEFIQIQVQVEELSLCNRKRHQLLRNQLMRWQSQNRRINCSETYLAVSCRIHANRIRIVNVLKCAVT